MPDIKGMLKPAFFSALIVVFAVCHTLFMRMNLPAYGPRIGTYLDDVSYAALVALILYLIFHLPSLPRKTCLLTFVLAIQFLVFAEWWNFEFYRDYIRYASLGHAADWKEIARGLDGFESRHIAILGSLGFLVTAYLLEKNVFLLKAKTSNRLFVFGLMALMALVPTAVYTKFYTRTQIDHWRRSVAIPLNYKNPVLQLFRERFLDKAEIATIKPRHVEAVNQLYGNTDSVYPFYKKGENAGSANLKNIIFVTLESIRKYETISKNGVELTPNLNRIAEVNFTPKYYYANSNQTIKAEIALFCGMHDFLIGTSVSAPNHQEIKTNCLPHILKKHGYRSYWFHGSGSSFFNRDQFLPRMGFDELHDQFAIEKKYKEDGKYYSLRHWGVEDPYTFDYALEHLEQAKQPFFAEILTVSNHHPFVDLEKSFREEDFHPDLPRQLDDIYNRYQHLIYYTDKALGRFWRAFEQSPLYDNTVVVISGDHGIWLFSDELENHVTDKVTLQYESYLRLPLTIYFPDKSFSEPIDITMSQVDVPEIIMTYLGLDDARAFQSKLDKHVILRAITDGQVPEKVSNPVFSSIGDNFYYNNDGIICYPPVQTRENCDDFLLRCVEEHNVLKTDKQCVSIQGDALLEEAITKNTAHETLLLNIVVDYFRKSIYFGALPEKDIINSNRDVSF